MNPVEPRTLYPTRDTLSQVVSEAAQKLPIMNFNDVFGLLMTYHNTLLHALAPKLQDAERYGHLRKGNHWIVAATQTGFHVDGEELDALVDSEMLKLAAKEE